MHERHRALATAFALAVLGGPAVASAQGGLYVGGGLGPAVRIDDLPTQIRLEQEVGYYVEGRPAGFFVGFAPSQSFGADYWLLTFAPRFGYMFELYRTNDLSFQLGPTGTIPGIAVGNFFDGNRDADVYFHFSLSLGLRLLLDGGRIALYLRPVEFEFAFGNGHPPWGDDSGIRYVLQGGVHFHF
ncbi:MAG TPA: hypothetical protein VIL20_00255 [Sandaracinaceae bacterium]